jgi:hypothetical protein
MLDHSLQKKRGNIAICALMSLILLDKYHIYGSRPRHIGNKKDKTGTSAVNITDLSSDKL